MMGMLTTSIPNGGARLVGYGSLLPNAMERTWMLKFIEVNHIRAS